MTKAELTEQIQKECVEHLAKVHPNSVADESYAIDSFIFSKLAEIELRLRKLENTTVRRLADNNDDTDF